MSASATCPLCGYHSRNIAVPDERWGNALNQVQLEDAFDEDAKEFHDNLLQQSRTTFWCPCGRMVWMEGIGWMARLDEMTEDQIRRIISAMEKS